MSTEDPSPRAGEGEPDPEGPGSTTPGSLGDSEAAPRGGELASEDSPPVVSDAVGPASDAPVTADPPTPLTADAPTPLTADAPTPLTDAADDAPPAPADDAPPTSAPPADDAPPAPADDAPPTSAAPAGDAAPASAGVDTPYSSDLAGPPDPVGAELSPLEAGDSPPKQTRPAGNQFVDAGLQVSPAKPEETSWRAVPAEQDRPWARWLGSLAFMAAFVFALVTRLAYLDAKPLHHDEGVNAHFLFGLLSEGRYHYDPTNYHGPFLYFFGYLPFKVWGSTPLGLRILPALCGALSLLLLLPLRRLMGWAGVACAAWLLAISPISTYVARTAIHETYFAAAVVAVVVVVVAYSERRRTWLPTAGALAVALAYANKETAVISYGAYVCGLGLALLFAKELRGGLRVRLTWGLKSVKDLWGKTASWYPPVPHWIPAVAFLLLVAVGYLVSMGGRVLLFGSESDNSWQAYERLIEFAPAPAVGVLWAGLLALCVYLLWGLRHELKRYWREQPTSRRPWLIAIYLAATLMVLLFSSLFSSVPGLTGLVSSLYHWVKRGVAMEKTGHEHPWPYYFKLLWRFEAPLMILAPIGILVAALRRRAGDLMILGWGLSTIAVYTVLAYKTPWLVVNLILPLALLSGIGLGALGRFLGRWRRGWGEGVLALLMALLLLAPAVPPEPARRIESWERATTWPTLVASPSWPYLGEGEPPLVVRASTSEEDPWARWRPEAAWWRLQWSLNILSPDDSRYGPVYAQTDRGAVALFEHLRREVEAGKKLSVVCSEYWPLPAYLYPGRAGGYPSSVPEELKSDLYLLSQDQDNKAYERFRGWERKVFPLRTGVKLVLRSRRPKRPKRKD